MTTTLRFRQHSDFHRSTLLMISAGLLAGLLVSAFASPGSSPWAVALVAAAAIAGTLTRTFGPVAYDLAARLGLGAMAAAALVLIGRSGAPVTALVAFGLLFGAGAGWGLRGTRFVAALGLGVGVAVIGRQVFVSVVTAQELSTMPGWLAGAGAGAAFSLVSALALLPRHVEILRDPVAVAYGELGGSLSGEIKELVDRGNGLWNHCADVLDQDDANRTILQEGVLRLFDVARRWRSVDDSGVDQLAKSLIERIEGLEQRIEKSDDAVVKTQYQEARAALVQQLHYIKDIGVSRERVLARMHNYLAAMERLRLAAINLESTNASREATDVQPLVASLQSIGADMDSCSTALIEADRAVNDGSFSA